MNSNNRFFNNPYQYGGIQNQNPYSNIYSQQQPMLNNRPPLTGIIKVNGLDGAKAFQMGANEVAVLFHESENILYIKTTDGAAFPTIKTFDIHERVENDKPTDVTNFVTKEEFENFKKELLGKNEQQ